MKKLIFAVFLIAFCVLALQAKAQSGSVPPEPDPSSPPSSGGSALEPTPEVLETPALEVPVAESLQSDPTPATPAPKVTKPKATAPQPKPEPTVISLGTAEIVIEEEVPEADNSVFKILAGVGALLGLGFLVSKVYKNKKTKEEKDDPCSGIKSKRDAKKLEFKKATLAFSAQEVLVEKIKEKLEKETKDKLAEKAKDIVLGTVGNNTLNNAVKVAEKGKKIYENVTEKYKKAKEILETLKQKKEKLNTEVEALEVDCQKCMMESGVGTLVNKGLKLEVLADTDVRKTTLLFLLKPAENKILLAMKKRGFGVGKWNGVGGKLAEGETVKGALIRETLEEIQVTVDPDDLNEVATIAFNFKDKKEFNQVCHVFSAEKWQGQPKETEEMNPKWYDTNALPYESMWIDDIHWLPRVIQGEKLQANFHFNKEGDKILDMKIEQV